MRNRDYHAEYRRRVDRGKVRGLSRSQARGHARFGEKPITPKTAERDPKAETALKILRKTGSLTKAAKEAGLAPERFRRFLGQHDLAKRHGRSWILNDERPRDILIFSRGRSRKIRVAGFAPASTIGRYLEAVKHLLETNDPARLTTFVGEKVVDIRGRTHPFETDPNTLYRLSVAGNGTFEQVYRLAYPI